MENNSQKAKALRVLGERYSDKGDTKKALKVLTESVALAKKCNDFATTGLSLFEIASIHSMADAWNKSISLFLQALRHLKKANSSKLSFAIESCYYKLIPDLLVNNKPNLAEKYLNMAIKDSVFGAEYLSDMFINFGYFYFNKEDYQKSLDFFRRALRLAANSRRNKAEATSYIGRSLYYLSDFDKAKEYLLAADPLLKRDKETRTANAKFLKRTEEYLSKSNE